MYIQNFRKFHQTIWILAIFEIFVQLWLFFGQKSSKMTKSKNSFLVNFLLLRSIYIPNFRKFHQPVWIYQIFFIFGQFWLFFGQKRVKKGQNRKSGSVGIFLFTKRHLHTKFQKISSNSSQDNLWRTDERTNGRTHKGESIGPFGLQPGTKKEELNRLANEKLTRKV